MGNLLNVAAELKIDVSPGRVCSFELLGLEKLGYICFLAPLGYRMKMQY
jgi:hypothetical protein